MVMVKIPSLRASQQPIVVQIKANSIYRCTATAPDYTLPKIPSGFLGNSFDASR